MSKESFPHSVEAHDRRSVLKSELDRYFKKGVSIRTIYRNTPLEKGVPYGSFIGNLPFNIDTVRQGVQRIEGFARRSIEEEKQIGPKQEEAIEILKIIEAEAEAAKPNPNKLDQRLAKYTTKRIEEFFETLPRRNLAARKPLSPETMAELQASLEPLRQFSQGPKEYFGALATNPDYVKLYKNLKDYPFVVTLNVLESIRLKTEQDVGADIAFDPMSPSP